MTVVSTFRFHVVLVDDLFIRGFSGRIVHGAFLQFMREYDEEVSDYLHKNQNKRPYSTTCMEFYELGDQWVAHFDINTVDKYLISKLIGLVTSEQNQEIFLVDRMCPILKIEYKKTVIPEPELLPIGTSIRFRFNSTTVFSNSKRDANTDPFPHIDVIWSQLIKNYSRLIEDIPSQDSAILIRKLLNQLATPHFVLRSRHEKLGHKIKVTGFVGTILFVIEDNTDLEILKSLLILNEVWGIGSKTTMGFGNIEVVIKRPKREKNNNKDSKKTLKLENQKPKKHNGNTR